MKAILTPILILVICLVSACGKRPSGGGIGVEELPEEPEGIFIANIFPVNYKLSGDLNGTVIITKYGDNFDVRVKMKNGPGGLHMQGLYDGESCPYDDSNGDGFIDIREAQKIIHEMIIPFDGDLSSRGAGSEYYPSDNYSYERSTSFALMVSDLSERKQKIQLNGKVVVIHGVAETDILPATLSTQGEQGQHKSIPIACGTLSKVAYEPDEEPERLPARVRNRPDSGPQPEVEQPIPPVERPRSRWERIRDRLDSWWRRITRRGDYPGKP